MPKLKIKRRKRKKEKPKTKKKLNLKWMIFLAIIVVFFFIITKIWADYIQPTYFQIKQVNIMVDGKLKQIDSWSFAGINKKSNIFDVNLYAIKNKIASEHPELKQIKVDRFFPAALKITLSRRASLCLIKSGNYYKVVGKEGVIIERTKSHEQFLLPIVEGMDEDIRGLKVGKNISSSRFFKIKDFLNAYNTSFISKKYKITKIDISDSRNLYFDLEDNTEIRLGSAQFKQRLDLLEKILNDLSKDNKKVSYIDLRFKDPVIGPR